MVRTRAGALVGTGIDLEVDGAFTVKQFLDRYGIGHTAFYEEVKAGRLTVKKRGSRTLVSRAAARAWFDALPDVARLGTGHDAE